MTIIFFIIICIIIYILTPKQNQLLSVFMIAFLMSVSAFYMTGENQHDINVYRELYDTLLDGGISAALLYGAVDRSPLFIWLVYVMTFLEDNRYTSAIPTFIGYFILLYVAYKTFKKYNIRKQKQVLCILFLLFIIPWQDYTGGVRGALAYSLCSLSIYFDFRKQKKKLALMFYIISIFIHQASVIFLVLRLFVLLIGYYPFLKKTIYLLCLLVGCMTEFMGPVIEFFAKITGLGILSIISNSFNSYAVEGKELYEVSVVILRVTAILIIFLSTRNYIKDHNETSAESSIFSIYTMLLLLAIGFIWQYDIICRYSVACMILSPLILYRCNSKYIIVMIVFAILNLVRYYDSYYSKWEILFQ